MTDPTIPQTVLFLDLFDEPLVATFDREQASSDGGAALLKAAERVYGLVKAFGRCLVDRRAPEKVRHTLEASLGALPPRRAAEPLGRTAAAQHSVKSASRRGPTVLRTRSADPA